MRFPTEIEQKMTLLRFSIEALAVACILAVVVVILGISLGWW